MVMLQISSFNLAVYHLGDTDSEKLALVLPGKLDTKDYPHMKSHVNFLSRQGYLALSFDPPGTWESEGEIHDYTMTNYLMAITELIEHYGNRPTLLVGHSRGGSMAMLGALRNPYVNSFVAIMSQAGPSRFDSEVVEGCTISMRDLPDDPSKMKKFKLPLSYYNDARKFDLLPELGTCVKPKLFIFGTQDDIIKPEIVKAAYTASAEPKWIESVESGHDYRYDSHIIDQVNKKIFDFLVKNIGARHLFSVPASS